MGWNYRVMKQTHADGRTTFALHETYYTKEGQIDGWTAEPSEPYGETLEELRVNLEQMTRALDYEVIEVEPKPSHDEVLAHG